MYFIFTKYICGSGGKKVSCELVNISSCHTVPSDFIHFWLKFSQIQCFATYKCNNIQHGDTMMIKLLLLLLLLFERFKKLYIYMYIYIYITAIRYDTVNF